VTRLRETGVPVYVRIEQAVGALAGSLQTEPTGIPPMPAAAAPISDGGYAAGRQVLMDAGIPFPRLGMAGDAAEAEELAGQIGYPVAVKASFLLHKSDAGGVFLNLRSASAVRSALLDIRARLGDGPVSIEAMAEAGGQELIIGVRRDPRFGPVLMAGLGGIYTEIWEDVAVELAPVDFAAARRMLERLRAARLLSGARGQPPLDMGGAARVMAILSNLAAAHPEWEAVEINPLRVYEDGVLALDSRVIPMPAGEHPAP
ncbi:MAG: acetate--CoA ligase family protein, partial [Clostridia bacterium]